MKQRILTITLVLSGLFAGQNTVAQCPNLSVSAAPICDSYYEPGGYQVANVTVNGTLPAGWTVVNTGFRRNYYWYPSGQLNAPSTVAAVPNAAGGVFPNYEIHDYNMDPANTYYIVLTFNTGGSNTQVCTYPITIPMNYSPATPGFVTHFKSVNALQNGASAITSEFCGNDPITIDVSSTTGALHYYLECTPVNSSGTAIGPVYFNQITYDPVTDVYVDLRAAFSNLVNPSGINVYAYYNIRLFTSGCGGGLTYLDKVIRVSNKARSERTRSAFNEPDFQLNPDELIIVPNPSEGLFTVVSSLKGPGTLRVHSLDGTEVYRYEGEQLQRRGVDLSFVAKGWYLVTVECEGTTLTQKLAIQ